MNIVQNIASQIENRVEEQSRQQKDRTGKPFGKRAKDIMNMELWAGAAMGVIALKGADDDDAKWVIRVFAMLVYPRGYIETQEIAAKGRQADEAGATPLDLDKKEGR
jgi:hypothetical protein